MSGTGPQSRVSKLIAVSRERLQRAEELLQQSTPDTFLGRKGEEPSAEDAKRTEQAREVLDEYAQGLRAFLEELPSVNMKSARGRAIQGSAICLSTGYS